MILRCSQDTTISKDKVTIAMIGAHTVQTGDATLLKLTTLDRKQRKKFQEKRIRKERSTPNIWIGYISVELE